MVKRTWKYKSYFWKKKSEKYRQFAEFPQQIANR